MKLKTSILFFFMLSSFALIAQYDFREFNTNDSTTYVLNNDTTIVASKTKLYFHANGEISQFYDFSNLDTDLFIRDFDIITEELWYVIFGDRYWGGPSTLYKTMDKGATWLVDSSIYNATQQPLNDGLIADESLYQLQRISEDTLLFFVSYYQSGVFYSINSGQSWNLWFANVPANYKGLFKCDDDYFLWGQEGDGFPASMFSFTSDLLLSPDTNNVWAHWSGSYVYHPDCYNGNNTDCIFAPNSMTGYEQFLFFENYINENCSDSPVGIDNESLLDKVQIYPNPSLQGKFSVEWDHDFLAPNYYNLFSANGQLIYSNEIKNANAVDIDLSILGQGHGLYFLVLQYEDKLITKKIVY